MYAGILQSFLQSFLPFCCALLCKGGGGGAASPRQTRVTKAHDPSNRHPVASSSHQLPEPHILHDQQPHLAICMDLLGRAQMLAPKFVVSTPNKGH